MDRIIGAFIFPDVWKKWDKNEASRVLDSLAGMGVNTICTESEDYRDDLIDLCHQRGMKWFGGISCFSDHNHNHQAAKENPEYWPIGEDGRPRPEMEWYLGVTPSFANYRESRLKLAEKLVSQHDMDGFFLDFIRWPLHWELEIRTKAPPPLHYSFDRHTLDVFQEESGVNIPSSPEAISQQAAWILSNHYQEWVDFKCNMITHFVKQAATRLRSLRPEGFCLGLFALPMPTDELEGYAGQRLPDLIPLVDFIAPMVYHAILHRPYGWAVSHVESTSSLASGKTLPVLQVDSAEGTASGADWGPPVPTEEWRLLLEAICSNKAIGGMIAFTGTALFQDGRGDVLKKIIARES